MSSIIVEIRAGTGGEEAALFCRDLFRMYSRYFNSKGWKVQILDEHLTGLGGLKQVIFKIEGENVFSKMKYEGGVHRVQRIPKTEKGNRVHTSTVSVAVLKIPSPTEIKIANHDLKMDFFKASGAGGQYVNKRQTAVRLTHLPSGIVVSSQVSRNLEENKKSALSILRAKLYEKEREEKEEKISQERKIQIGRAQRAEKIRTYNFPQDRITDHRLQKSWYNLEKILDGKLEVIIKAFQKKRSD
ncbi:MAG: PCRF domain-containing protein [Patescibacteria group bacterium]|nr:PCRF domain-containing protein [Patescibacteria group bacterium]